MNGEQPPLDVDAPTYPYAISLPPITTIVPLHCYCRKTPSTCVCGKFANSTTISRTIFHNVPAVGLRTAVLRALIRNHQTRQVLYDCVYDYVLTSNDEEDWQVIFDKWGIADRFASSADTEQDNESSSA
jgi:hypothetical protein